MQDKCPKCHTAVRPTDYFCFNCGNNLKPAPPSTTLVSQLALYAKSILLPPFGILWAYKYLRYKDSKTRLIGVVAIVLTLASLVVSYFLLQKLVGDINRQVNEQFKYLDLYY